MTPEQSTVLQSEHLSLLLDISWLYEVNITISIRESAIEVRDSAAALLLTCNDLSETDEKSISSSEKLTDVEKKDDKKSF